MSIELDKPKHLKQCFCLMMIGVDTTPIRLGKWRLDVNEQWYSMTPGTWRTDIPDKVQSIAMQCERDRSGDAKLPCSQCKHKLECLINPDAQAVFEPR